MIDAYKIGIKLSIQGRLSSQLTGLIAKFQTLNDEVLKLKANLNGLGQNFKTNRFIINKGGSGSGSGSSLEEDVGSAAAGGGLFYALKKHGLRAVALSGAEIAAPLAGADFLYHSVKNNTGYQYYLSSVQTMRNATDAQMAQVNRILEDTTTKYGISLTKNAMMFHDIVTGSALNMRQLISIYPSLVKTSTAYRYMHPGSSGASGVELLMKVAHATGNYSPENIKMIRHAVLGFSATTNVSKSQIMSALTYSIKPGLQAFGDTPQGLHNYFALMSAFSRQGNLRSLGGRNFADFFIDLVKPGSKSSMQSMIALGLWGPQGSTIVDKNGRINLKKLQSILKSDKSQYSPTQLMSLEYGAYGKQAGLILNTMTSKNFWQQYGQSYNAQKIASLNSIISRQNNTLMGQFKIFEGNMSVLMNAIGKDLQPPLYAFMKYVLNPVTKGVGLFARGVSYATNPKTYIQGAESIWWLGKKAFKSIESHPFFINPNHVGEASFTTPIHTHIHLDGRKIAEAVTHHQTYQMQQEPTTTSNYNFLAGFTPSTFGGVM